MSKKRRRRIALVLSGGGARGAYQAGAIRALAEISKEIDGGFYISILSGVSAGAVNASFLAANMHDIQQASEKLVELWSNVRTRQVFRTDIYSLSRIGFRWISDTVFAGKKSSMQSGFLLDASPFIEFLKAYIDFNYIEKNLQDGLFEALTISATDYTTAENVTFVQSGKGFSPWMRARRISEAGIIKLEHVCASAAIPLFFSPVKLGHRYFGDGCLRNTAPLSPALHLDAEALIVIGVQYQPFSPSAHLEPEHPDHMPSIARILSVLLNSVMLDGVAADVERLKRINRTLSLIPEEERHHSHLRIADCLYINPSENLSRIAEEEYRSLPRTLRYLLDGLGSADDSGNLVSYLLFEPAYARRLCELGYKDGLHHREKILELLQKE